MVILENIKVLQYYMKEKTILTLCSINENIFELYLNNFTG